MKPVEEWMRGHVFGHYGEDFELIEKVQADARAGMVSEGDARDKLYAQVAELLRAKHQAELAKAWEAGRTEAAEVVRARSVLRYEEATSYSESRLPAEARDIDKLGDELAFVEGAIRALQPPGGKAKP